jgi:hypothetical protein
MMKIELYDRETMSEVCQFSVVEDDGNEITGYVSMNSDLSQFDVEYDDTCPSDNWEDIEDALRSKFLETPEDGTIKLKLVEALEHALKRLNDIPHRYIDTDFELINEALKLGKGESNDKA